MTVSPDTVLVAGDVMTEEQAAALHERVGTSNSSLYGISLVGGSLDGAQAVGRRHPATLGDGPVDWWPALVRESIWEPLGLDAGYQWLLLGVGVGLVMGGSQALARSLFAQIVPHTRSGEFFSFFGFMGRVSSVFGADSLRGGYQCPGHAHGGAVHHGPGSRRGNRAALGQRKGRRYSRRRGGCPPLR